MRGNRFDTIIGKAEARAGKVRSYINRVYGKVEPLNTELTPAVDILYTYEKIMLPENQMIIEGLVKQHGLGAWIGYQRKALQSKKARGL